MLELSDLLESLESFVDEYNFRTVLDMLSAVAANEASEANENDDTELAEDWDEARLIIRDAVNAIDESGLDYLGVDEE